MMIEIILNKVIKGEKFRYGNNIRGHNIFHLNFFLGNLIGGIWFVFIGMFLNQAAKSGYQMTVFKDVLSGVKVKNVMTSNVISVPEFLSLNDLVQNYFYHHLFVSFPVVRDGGELIGIVSVS